MVNSLFVSWDFEVFCSRQTNNVPSGRVHNADMDVKVYVFDLTLISLVHIVSASLTSVHEPDDS